MAPSFLDPSNAPPGATRRDALLRVARGGAGVLLLSGPRLAPASAASSEAFSPVSSARLRFALPLLDEALASRAAWEPLLHPLCAAVGCALETATLSSLESLARAVAHAEVDAGFLAPEAALQAVVEGRMRILAQPKRPAAQDPNRAVLLVRRAAPPDALDRLLAEPQDWRIAYGERRSIAGYVLPQARLFLPRGIDMETAFRTETVGSTFASSLALANGDVDIATGTLDDHRLFCRRFPPEGRQLKIVWQSEPLPAERFAIRADWPRATRQEVRRFLLRYGAAAGPRSAQERAVLRALNAPAGYEAAPHATLLPVAQLQRDLALQRVRAAQWTSDAARARRLAQIAAEYERQKAVLLRDEERAAG